MSDFHYNQLSAKQKKIYNSLFEAIGGRRDAFNVDTADLREVSPAFEAFSFDHPEYFYVDLNDIKMTIVSPGKGKVELRYFYTPDETALRKNKIDAAIGRLLDNRDFAGADALGRVRLIHDRLVRSVTYESNASVKGMIIPDALTIEGVFLRGSAVCEGISKAVTYLGQKLGLDIPTVTGTATLDGKNHLPHAWNVVNIGGNYAHLDVTWDITLSTPLKFTRYDYFCVPDVDMREDHAFGGFFPCAHDIGLSFFERSHRIFHDMDSCKKFISEKLKERSDVIYFKFPDHTVPAETAVKRMDDTVTNMLRIRSLFMFDMEKAHNPTQGVYFYRVLKRL